MKKPERPHASRRKHLSKEDELLWEHTASSLAPLKRAKGRIHPAAGELEDETRGIAGSAASHRPSHQHTAHPKSHAALKHEPHLPPAKKRPVPELAAFDAKKARKIRQGRADIEARIDLHGMRQSEAHAALRRFLLSCFQRGFRNVLVITGKGSPSRRADHDEHEGYQERGVLKRNVPIWLAEPDVRAIVVSYTTAAIQHGGEGALYVHLRNPERVLR